MTSERAGERASAYTESSGALNNWTIMESGMAKACFLSRRASVRRDCCSDRSFLRCCCRRRLWEGWLSSPTIGAELFSPRPFVKYQSYTRTESAVHLTVPNCASFKISFAYCSLSLLYRVAYQSERASEQINEHELDGIFPARVGFLKVLELTRRILTVLLSMRIRQMIGSLIYRNSNLVAARSMLHMTFTEVRVRRNSIERKTI